MDCFGTGFTHVQACDVTRVYVTRVRSARECIALVQTLHMPKPVM